MRFAFYKAEYGDWLDKLIAWYTRGPYSHVEMFFEKDNICFSSSPRDGGTRWKTIPDIKTSGKWVIVDTPYVDENKLKIKCNAQLGKKYDWFCIFFNFVIPFDIHDPKRWICSEICAKLVLKLKYAFKFSPNSLFKEVTKCKK